MAYDTLRVVFSDVQREVTRHEALTICQNCGELAQSFHKVRVHGSMVVEGTRDTPQVFEVVTCLCATCYEADCVRAAAGYDGAQTLYGHHFVALNGE